VTRPAPRRSVRTAVLPGAEELFRMTTRRPPPARRPPTDIRTRRDGDLTARTEHDDEQDRYDQHDREDEPLDRGESRRTEPNRVRQARVRRASARTRHDTKITVYISAEELHALELARLTLRTEHGIVVDRGRLVRESVAIALDDLDVRGYDSVLLHRLREPMRPVIDP
jgi:hypothetical protein